MNATLRGALVLLLLLGPSGFDSASAAETEPVVDERIRLKLDTDEADAVLAILARVKAGREIDEREWQRLFKSRPYLRLKQRESQMHRDFSDDEFRQFVLSPELAQRADDLSRTLEAWRQTDLAASARRVLAYLPDSARIQASVYPVIKPRTNSFVFEPAKDAAIFLYLDTRLSAAQFENTVAHEMHHIGFASVESLKVARLGNLPPNVKSAIEWMGAFGEGFAMLAAAGGPDAHPHATSPPEERARWDRDMAHFNADLKRAQKFFLDILNGRLRTEDEIAKVGFTFFGVQGPWYTVGYRMAVLIEKRYGRATLIECMQDPRILLARYNAVAAAANRAGGKRLALWSPELLRKIGVGR